MSNCLLTMPSPITVSSALLENGWEEIGALPVLLAHLASLQHPPRKREDPRGMRLVIQDTFPVQPPSRLPFLHAGPTLCTLLAGQQS